MAYLSSEYFVTKKNPKKTGNNHPILSPYGLFKTKDGNISRYNLRKFGELAFQLIRCKQFDDLYKNVLFNYQWLYAKMSACPLQG